MAAKKNGTTAAEIVDELRRLILSGGLLAGQQLRQEEFAARFGVSRTPLREAVARLEAEGLVVTEPNRGAVVFRPSTTDLEEIYQVRLLLEPRAAHLAALQCAGQPLDDLEAINQAMIGAPAWEYARLNSQFHTRFYALSGQSRLCAIIRTLHLQADPYVSMLIGGGGGARAVEDHREILHFARAGDPDTVQDITRRHLNHTLSLVGEIIGGSRRDDSSS